MITQIKCMVEDVHPVIINNSKQKQQTVIVETIDDHKIKKLTLFGNKVSSFLATTEKGMFLFDYEIRNVLTESGRYISYFNVVDFARLDDQLN